MSAIEVVLPDSSKVQVEENSTVADVAAKISEGLARNAVCAMINDEVKSLCTTVT